MMTNSNQSKISIFVIATNSYVEYALNLIKSYSQWDDVGLQVQFLLLTDVEIDLQKLDRKENLITINSFRIPSYGWPEATLLRFHLMLNHWDHVTGDIIMYLDADTKIVAPFEVDELLKICSSTSSNGVAPVLHPGYYKRSFLRNTFNKTRFGPWENRRGSTAFVPYKLRKNYVCGGVIWGLNKSFFQLCTDIKAKIDLDLQQGIIAKHNDESHLNKWFVSHPTIAASSEWAYADGYKNLTGLKPRIQVIHKPMSFIRVPTNLN